MQLGCGDHLGRGGRRTPLSSKLHHERSRPGSPVGWQALPLPAGLGHIPRNGSLAGAVGIDQQTARQAHGRRHPRSERRSLAARVPRRRILAGIMDPEPIIKILAHLGLATAPPPLAPVRAPPGGICPRNDKAADWPPTGMPRASWPGPCTYRPKSGALPCPKGLARPSQEWDLVRQPALADRPGGQLLFEFPMPPRPIATMPVVQKTGGAMLDSFRRLLLPFLLLLPATPPRAQFIQLGGSGCPVSTAPSTSGSPRLGNVITITCPSCTVAQYAFMVIGTCAPAP